MFDFKWLVPNKFTKTMNLFGAKCIFYLAKASRDFTLKISHTFMHLFLAFGISFKLDNKGFLRSKGSCYIEKKIFPLIFFLSFFFQTASAEENKEPFFCQRFNRPSKESLLKNSAVQRFISYVPLDPLTPTPYSPEISIGLFASAKEENFHEIPDAPLHFPSLKEIKKENELSFNPALPEAFSLLNLPSHYSSRYSSFPFFQKTCHLPLKSFEDISAENYTVHAYAEKLPAFRKKEAFPLISREDSAYQMTAAIFEKQDFLHEKLAEMERCIEIASKEHFFSYKSYKLDLQPILMSKRETLPNLAAHILEDVALTSKNLHFHLSPSPFPSTLSLTMENENSLWIEQKSAAKKICFKAVCHPPFISLHGYFAKPEQTYADVSLLPEEISFPFHSLYLPNFYAAAENFIPAFQMPSDAVELIFPKGSRQAFSFLKKPVREVNVLCSPIFLEDKKYYEKLSVQAELAKIPSKSLCALIFEQHKPITHAVSFTFEDKDMAGCELPSSWKPRSRQTAFVSIAELDAGINLLPRTFEKEHLSVCPALPLPEQKSFSLYKSTASFHLAEWRPPLDFYIFSFQRSFLVEEKAPKKMHLPQIPKVLLAAKKALKFPLEEYFAKGETFQDQIPKPVYSTSPAFLEKNPLQEHMLSAMEAIMLPKMKTKISKYLPPFSQIALYDFQTNMHNRLKEKAKLEESKLRTPYNFAFVPILSDLDTISYRDEFTVKPKLMPREDGQGYIFSVTFQPRDWANLKRSKQNIFFLIDRSGSIESHRFDVFRQAVERSLPYLSHADTFNIAFFDSKVSFLSEEGPLKINHNTLSRAKAFLRSHKGGAYFTEGDIYKVIEEIYSQNPSPDHTTFILLSNGKKLKNMHKQRDKLAGLLQKNAGSFSIFTAAIGNNNNLAMLDCISKLHHGELLYSQTHAAFPRKLAVLVKNLTAPIAENIRVHAVTEDADVHIQLYPAACTLPGLYQDRPFTVYGTINKIKDFHICLQGKVGGKWLNITKPVYLNGANTQAKHLMKEFTAQKIYSLYYNYITEFNPAVLNEIERLSKPLNMNVPL
ncbi:MAG: hypothetical protein Tsb0015_05360 [Simkaniaceae bacterium]